MAVLNRNSTNSIKKQLVAIISVVLILMTTIGFVAPLTGGDVFAAKNEEKPQVKNVRMPEVSSTSYIVMSGSTSEVIESHHVERKMQPGSITMLMTAMVVLDNMRSDDELDNKVDIDKKLAEKGDTFAEGETVSVGDLLSAMLVTADPQAAEALASYSASKRSIFVSEMNSKCMELGLMDTQFSNPSGTESTKQYSTAKDLAVITQAAFRYQKIKDLLALKSVKIKAETKEKEREMELGSADPLLRGDKTQVYEFIEGGICGSPGVEGNLTQLAAAAVKDDMQYIVILMNSDKTKMAAEAKGLFEYGDSKATKNQIVKKGFKAGHARVRGGARTRVAAYTTQKGFAYVPPEGSEALVQTEVVMFDEIEAPLKKGDKVGEYRIYVADELKGTVDLVIKRDVPKGWWPSRYYISNRTFMVVCTLLGMAFLFWIRVRSVRRRREKRYEAMRQQRILELAKEQMRIDEDRRKRNWTGMGYDPMPPRTTDIRREAIEGEADKKR